VVGTVSVVEKSLPKLVVVGKGLLGEGLHGRFVVLGGKSNHWYQNNLKENKTTVFSDKNGIFAGSFFLSKKTIVDYAIVG
jgi:hypothetical protein